MRATDRPPAHPSWDIFSFAVTLSYSLLREGTLAGSFIEKIRKNPKSAETKFRQCIQRTKNPWPAEQERFKRLKELLEQCLSSIPSSRPNAKEVEHRLAELITKQAADPDITVSRHESPSPVNSSTTSVSGSSSVPKLQYRMGSLSENAHEVEISDEEMQDSVGQPDDGVLSESSAVKDDFETETENFIGLPSKNPKHPWASSRISTKNPFQSGWAEESENDRVSEPSGELQDWLKSVLGESCSTTDFKKFVEAFCNSYVVQLSDINYRASDPVQDNGLLTVEQHVKDRVRKAWFVMVDQNEGHQEHETQLFQFQIALRNIETKIFGETQGPEAHTILEHKDFEMKLLKRLSRVECEYFGTAFKHDPKHPVVDRLKALNEEISRADVGK